MDRFQYLWNAGKIHRTHLPGNNAFLKKAVPSTKTKYAHGTKPDPIPDTTAERDTLNNARNPGRVHCFLFVTELDHFTGLSRTLAIAMLTSKPSHVESNVLVKHTFISENSWQKGYKLYLSAEFDIIELTPEQYTIIAEATARVEEIAFTPLTPKDKVSSDLLRQFTNQRLSDRRTDEEKRLDQVKLCRAFQEKIDHDRRFFKATGKKPKTYREPPSGYGEID